MGNAITWGSLFGAGFIVGGLALIGVGLISTILSGGNESEADLAGPMGCAFALGGLVLLALGIWMERN